MLFRQEVLIAKEHQWLGSAQVGLSKTLIRAAAVGVIAGCALLIFGATAQIARRTTATGMLVPTQPVLAVAAPQSGSISVSNISEGEHVAAGDVLATINVDRSIARGEAATMISRQLELRSAALEKERTFRIESARDHE